MAEGTATLFCMGFLAITILGLIGLGLFSIASGRCK